MLPLTEKLTKSEIALPLYPMVKEEDVKYTIDKVKEQNLG